MQLQLCFRGVPSCLHDMVASLCLRACQGTAGEVSGGACSRACMGAELCPRGPEGLAE